VTHRQAAWPAEAAWRRRRRLARLAGCLAALPLCALSTGAVAHHSTAAYAEKTITLNAAVVDRLIWANPHSVLWVNVKDSRGTVTRWGAESGSPSALSRIGWSRTSVKAGDTILVELFPAKNGARVGRLARIVLPGGKELLDSVYKASPFDTIQKK
jgi:hypothetical protein